MAGQLTRRRITALMQRIVLARWARRAEAAAHAELGRLRHDRQQARDLRQQLDHLLAVADQRLAMPRIGSVQFPQPPGTDWAWRPLAWRGRLAVPGHAGVPSQTRLGPEMTLFHDCRTSDITLRQIRNAAETDLAAYGIALDVFSFDGSFLSLAIDLPDDACKGLARRHLIRLDTLIDAEKPIEIFARLNVRHGPNVEQVVRELPATSGSHAVEFDLAYTKLNEKRVEKAWVDLIFEGPQMNRVLVRDLTFARLPRAEL